MSALKRVSIGVMLYFICFVYLNADVKNFELQKEANKKGDYKSALNYAEMALSEDLKDNNITLVHSMQIASDYNNIGYFHQKLKEHDKALENYYKALERVKSQKDKKYSKRKSIYYNNIASAYESLSQYKKAIEYYKKASDIYEKELSEFHPYKASTYADIANAYLQMGNNEKALEYNLKALNIRKSGNLILTHPDMILSYYSVAKLNEVLGKDKDAILYYTELQDIFDSIANVDSNRSKEIKAKIKQLQQKQINNNKK